MAKPPEKSKPSPNVALKYSGLAFQIAVVVGLFAFGGIKLDEHYGTERPYFTAGLALVGVAVALYSALKDVFTDGK